MSLSIPESFGAGAALQRRCMTPCQPLTAWTDDLYTFVYYLNF